MGLPQAVVLSDGDGEMPVVLATTTGGLLLAHIWWEQHGEQLRIGELGGVEDVELERKFDLFEDTHLLGE